MPTSQISPTPTASVPAVDPAMVYQFGHHVVNLYRLQTEQGLFTDEGCKEGAAPIAANITVSLDYLSRGRTAEALGGLLQAESAIYQAYYGKPRRWRFFHRFRPHIVAYYLFVLAWLVVLGGNLWAEIGLPFWAHLPDQVWQVPTAVLAFGAMGALLRGFYGLNVKIAQLEFRPQFQLSYFLAPWIGALFAGMVYLGARAAFWTFQSQPPDPGQEEWGLWALAALAGYRWEWATERLTRAMQRLDAHDEAKTPNHGGRPAVAPEDQKS